MPKYRGRVDCYINPCLQANGGGIVAGGSPVVRQPACNEVFCNVVQLLSSSGPDLGIEMIAGNYGSGGTGWGFYDESNNIGNRAWACFRFHSASYGKFDMLIFTCYVNSTAFGSPITINAQSSNNVAGTFDDMIGISFASHPSGSNTTQSNGPWNGTYSLTSASIGNPVWKVNSEGKGTFFPRSNGIAGAFSGSRGNLAGLLGIDIDDPGIPWLTHTIVGQDCFIFVHEHVGTGRRRAFHIFSSFTPVENSSHQSPYFMLSTTRFESANPFRPGTYGVSTVGKLAGTRPYGDVQHGGVAHPDMVSGSRGFNFFLQNVDSTIAYNNYLNSGSLERFPIWIAINEQNPVPTYSIVGEANNIALAITKNCSAVSETAKVAALGSQAQSGTAGYNSDNCLVVPWTGPAAGESTRLRTGRNFSIDT